MLAGVLSLALTLWLGGFIAYQWALACEASAASLALFILYVCYYRHDPRKSKWPPLLPLAIIGAAGGAKSFYVATDEDTPLFVIVALLAAVVWFAISSWQIIRAST